MAILRISGHPGAGKTTLSKELILTLGYEYHYAGGIFREMAKEAGLSIEEYYRQLASDVSSEASVDNRLWEIMKSRDNLIIEGRVAPFQEVSYQTVNILLKVDPKEGARRELLRNENKDKSLEEMIALTKERVENERKHYKKLYGIGDHFDEKCFDIVIDTTDLSEEEVFRKVMSKLREIL